MENEINETTVNDILADVVTVEPEVTMTGEEEPTKKDKFGREFDPSLHNVDEFGVPKFLKNGSLSIKRGKGVKEEKKEAELTELKVDYRGQGMMLAKFTEAGGCLISEDFRFVKDKALGVDEEKYLGEAYASYLECKGIDDIPPGYLLLSALIFYAVPRLAKDNQKSKIKKMTKWIAGKIGF